MNLNEIMTPSALDPMIMAGDFSPDSRFFTYLKGSSGDPNKMDLWAYDLDAKTARVLVATNQLTVSDEQLSDEEKARRERLRLFVSGISSYEWSSVNQQVLLFLAGAIFLRQVDGGILPVVESGAMDAKFSPKGQYISWISERNLHLWNVGSRVSTPLTKHGGGTISVGAAEFVAEEELQRFEGYWWSEDEAYIAFEEFDESQVEIKKRHEIYADRVDIVEQRYPAAGKTNVSWKLGVLDINSRETIWIPTATEDTYLARAAWCQGAFFFMILNRLQTEAQIFRYDVKARVLKKILTETAFPWFNLVDKLRFTPGGDLVLVSERTGFASIFMYSADGEAKRSLCFKDESILKIVNIHDDAIDLICATKDGMGHVAKRCSLKEPGKEQILSDIKGVAGCVSSKDKRWAAIVQTSTHLPQRVDIIDLETSVTQVVHEAKMKPHILEKLSEPEFGSLEFADYSLFYRMIRPQDFDPKKKYPAIIYVYGGPHAQKVNHGWQGMYYLYAHYLASQGFVVFTLDNRGSANRGKSFESPISKAFGSIDLEDQISGARYLQSLPYIEGSRIGIYGWSYGGYLTLMAMCKAPDIFKVGSSGAPVTDWFLYDTAYTERYLGLPKEDPESYSQASVFSWTKGLQGRLQLIHGMADDNVLYVNSTMLYSELQKLGKPFEIQAYPGEKHALSSIPMRVHCYASITRFFKDNL